MPLTGTPGAGGRFASPNVSQTKDDDQVCRPAEFTACLPACLPAGWLAVPGTGRGHRP